MGSAREGGVDAGDSWGWRRGHLSLGWEAGGWACLAPLVYEWQRGSRIFFPSLPRSEQREALGPLPWTYGRSQPQSPGHLRRLPPEPAP